MTDKVIAQYRSAHGPDTDLTSEEAKLSCWARCFLAGLLLLLLLLRECSEAYVHLMSRSDMIIRCLVCKGLCFRCMAALHQ